MSAPVTGHTDIRAIAAEIAQELRMHPERWFQGALYKTDGGYASSVYDNAFDWTRVACACLEGHICMRVPFGQAADRIIEFKDASGLDDDINRWNDEPSRTVQEVIDVCERVAAHKSDEDVPK